MGTRFSVAVFYGLLVVAYASTTSATVQLVASSEAAAEISADSYRVKLRFTPDPEMSVWSRLKDGKEEHIGSFPLAGFVRSTEKVCGSDVSSPQFMKVSKEMKNDALTGQQNFCLLLLMAETSLHPPSRQLQAKSPRVIDSETCGIPPSHGWIFAWKVIIHRGAS